MKFSKIVASAISVIFLSFNAGSSWAGEYGQTPADIWKPAPGPVVSASEDTNKPLPVFPQLPGTSLEFMYKSPTLSQADAFAKSIKTFEKSEKSVIDIDKNLSNQPVQINIDVRQGLEAVQTAITNAKPGDNILLTGSGTLSGGTLFLRPDVTFNPEDAVKFDNLWIITSTILPSSSGNNLGGSLSMIPSNTASTQTGEGIISGGAVIIGTLDTGVITGNIPPGGGVSITPSEGTSTITITEEGKIPATAIIAYHMDNIASLLKKLNKGLHRAERKKLRQDLRREMKGLERSVTQAIKEAKKANNKELSRKISHRWKDFQQNTLLPAVIKDAKKDSHTSRIFAYEQGSMLFNKLI